MNGAVLPAETDAPLVVNADTPLPGPVAGQLFKAVSRRNAEEVEACGAMELFQFAQGRTLGVLGQSGREPAVK